MVLYRMARHKRYRAGWAHRLGKIVRRNPAKKCIWLHAVSVGEINAARTLIKEIQTRFADLDIVITATTDTGFARAKALFGSELDVFYFPLDFSWAMHRAFTNITPAICLLMELEVWPNFVSTAYRQGIPVVVVNGRISERGFSRYLKVRQFAKSTFEKTSLVLAQTEEYAGRFIKLGCPAEKVITVGSLKYDTAQTSGVEGADETARQLNLGAGPVWTAGGTGPGEEKIILDIYLKLKKESQNLRLAIIPRKPERFGEVAQLIKNAGLPLVRYSEIKAAAAKSTISNRKSTIDNRQSQIDSVVLGDTMGDLRKFYALADIIFVGRSLVPMGGSDMMEAAALGKCTMFGPHTFNFRQNADALLEGRGAILVEGSDELFTAMQKCIRQPEFAAETAKNGRNIIIKNQGATVRSINHIARFLKDN